MKELPGASLLKACRLLVAFCLLHLLAVVFYYLVAGTTLSLRGRPEPSPRRPAPPALPRDPASRTPPEGSFRPASSQDAACPEPSPLLAQGTASWRQGLALSHQWSCLPWNGCWCTVRNSFWNNSILRRKMWRVVVV